jgi:hypothetical protein
MLIFSVQSQIRSREEILTAFSHFALVWREFLMHSPHMISDVVFVPEGLCAIWNGTRQNLSFFLVDKTPMFFQSEVIYSLVIAFTALELLLHVILHHVSL